MDLRNDQQPCLKLKAIKNKLSHLVFCEICLFDHTWVITVFKLHQYNTIICQFYKKLLLHDILAVTDTEY